VEFWLWVITAVPWNFGNFSNNEKTSSALQHGCLHFQVSFSSPQRGDHAAYSKLSARTESVDPRSTVGSTHGAKGMEALNELSQSIL
jgi:hypothetical protein